jgi:hypothetical protein
MGTNQVIGISPIIKSVLAMIQVIKDVPLKHLCLQGSVKALLFPQCLGMIGTAVAHRDVQSDQPNGQLRIGMAIKPLGRSIVHDHRFGQSVSPKDRFKNRLNGASSLIPTASETHSEAGMIIEDRQRITTSSRLERKIAFEVHLPEAIGRFVLKALPGFMLRRFLGIQTTVTPQDLRDRAGSRDPRKPLAQKNPADLTPTPGRMMIPNGQDGLLQILCRPVRGAVGAARAVPQASLAGLKISGNPFVAALWADPVQSAQSSNMRMLRKSKCYKLPTQGHG